MVQGYNEVLAGASESDLSKNNKGQMGSKEHTFHGHELCTQTGLSWPCSMPRAPTCTYQFVGFATYQRS